MMMTSTFTVSRLHRQREARKSRNPAEFPKVQERERERERERQVLLSIHGIVLPSALPSWLRLHPPPRSSTKKETKNIYISSLSKKASILKRGGGFIFGVGVTLYIWTLFYTWSPSIRHDKSSNYVESHPKSLQKCIQNRRLQDLSP